MNFKERVDVLISVMEEVIAIDGKLRMAQWYTKASCINVNVIRDSEYTSNSNLQHDVIENIKPGIKEFHSCGTAACFIGWCALSPVINPTGQIISFPIGMVERFLGASDDILTDFITYQRISNKLSEIALYNSNIAYHEDDPFSEFYDKSIHDITPQDVIEKLKLLREMTF